MIDIEVLIIIVQMVIVDDGKRKIVILKKDSIKVKKVKKIIEKEIDIVLYKRNKGIKICKAY